MERVYRVRLVLVLAMVILEAVPQIVEWVNEMVVIMVLVFRSRRDEDGRHQSSRWKTCFIGSIHNIQESVWGNDSGNCWNRNVVRYFPSNN